MKLWQTARRRETLRENTLSTRLGAGQQQQLEAAERKISGARGLRCASRALRG